MRTLIGGMILLVAVACANSLGNCATLSCSGPYGLNYAICLDDGDHTFTTAWTEPSSGIAHECGPNDGKPATLACACASHE